VKELWAVSVPNNPDEFDKLSWKGIQPLRHRHNNTPNTASNGIALTWRAKGQILNPPTVHANRESGHI